MAYLKGNSFITWPWKIASQNCTPRAGPPRYCSRPCWEWWRRRPKSAPNRWTRPLWSVCGGRGPSGPHSQLWASSRRRRRMSSKWLRWVKGRRTSCWGRFSSTERVRSDRWGQMKRERKSEKTVFSIQRRGRFFPFRHTLHAFLCQSTIHVYVFRNHFCYWLKFGTCVCHGERRKAGLWWLYLLSLYRLRSWTHLERKCHPTCLFWTRTNVDSRAGGSCRLLWAD